MKLLSLTLLLLLPACETVKGATRDLDQAGRTLTTEARKAQAVM